MSPIITTANFYNVVGEVSMTMKALAALSAAFLLGGCSTSTISERQAEYRIDRGIDTVKSTIFVRSTDEPIDFSITFNNSDVDFIDSKDAPLHQDVSIALSGMLTMNHPKYLIETPVNFAISAHAQVDSAEGKLLINDIVIDEVAFKELYTSLSKDLRAPIASASLAQIETQLKSVVLIDTKRKGHDYTKQVKGSKINLVIRNTNL